MTVHGELLKAFRTGDRGRYRLADGELEFFGRMDHQVKIRGYRIELAEVEQALLQDDFVYDAVALARELNGGELELVSFVTIQPRHAASYTGFELQSGIGATDGRTLSQEQYQKAEDHLRTTLQIALPAYMIPARITILEKMPLNANGKVDRRALANIALDPLIAQGSRDKIAQEDNRDQALCEKSAVVSGLEVGTTNNLPDLRGDSPTLQEYPLDMAFHNVTKTIDVSQQSLEEISEQIQ